MSIYLGIAGLDTEEIIELEKEFLVSFEYAHETSAYSKAKSTESEFSLTVLGKIFQNYDRNSKTAQENILKINEWGRTSYKPNNDFYRYVEIKEEKSGLLVRKVEFPTAYVKHYEEVFDFKNYAGYFILVLAQKKNRHDEIEIDNVDKMLGGASYNDIIQSSIMGPIMPLNLNKILEKQEAEKARKAAEEIQKMKNYKYWIENGKFKYLPYNPDEWNEQFTRVRTNCYAYAFDLKENPTVLDEMGYPVPLQDGLQPGMLTDKYNEIGLINLSFLWFKGTESNKEKFIKLITSDAKAIGCTFEELSADNYKKNGVLLALVFNKSEKDYHFYRKNSDGSWSHKPGQHPVTNRELLGIENGKEKYGDICYDPIIEANNRGYDYFVGYYVLY